MNEEKQSVKVEYPFQVFVRKTQNKRGDNGVTKKTLTVDCHCDPTAPGQAPLEIFGPTSRAKITILRIDETNGKRTSSISPWANLPQRDFAAVLNKSQQASMINAQMQSPMQNMFANAATKEDVKRVKDTVVQGYGMINHMLTCLASLIRTGQIPQQAVPQTQQSNQQQASQVNVEEIRKLASANKLMGTMKNHTPLSFMLENNSEDGKQKMLGQITWLESKLSEHPNNQKLIDSIKAAIMLYDMKQLEGAVGSAGSVSSDIVIYESGPKGLNRKVKDDGFGPVKELSIIWHLGDNYPVEIIIKNYDAPIETKANGAINVMVSKRREPVEQESYRLAEIDYFDMLDKLRMNYDRYAMIMAAAQFKASTDASYANYQEYQKTKDSEQATTRQPQQPMQNAQYASQPQQVAQNQNTNNGFNGFGGNPFGAESGSLDSSLPFGNMGGSPFTFN